MPTTTRLLLIASKAGYQTEAFADAAARQGVRLDLATNRCAHLDDPWRDGALAIDFDDPLKGGQPELSLLSRDTGDSSGCPLSGIVAVGDHASVVAAILAERYRLPYHPPDAVRVCRSKFELRERFRNAGLLTPSYRRIPVNERVECPLPFPVVLKPISLSASRGVIRADNEPEFEAAFSRISNLLSRTPDLARDPASETIQIEEFIPGREFAIEGIMTHGRVQVLAIFDKPDPLDGPFFEETIYTTPSREPEEMQQAILETTQRAVTALGLTCGPIHAECRVNSRGVWMLEIAARPIGGLCARVLHFASGLGLEDVIIRHAIGQPVDRETLACGGSAVMMIPIPRAGVYQGVRGVDEASRVPGVESVEITAVAGQQLVPLPEGASYLGFIFARGSSAAEAEVAVREAHGKLAFEIQTALPMLRSGTRSA